MQMVWKLAHLNGCIENVNDSGTVPLWIEQGRTNHADLNEFVWNRCLRYFMIVLVVKATKNTFQIMHMNGYDSLWFNGIITKFAYSRWSMSESINSSFSLSWNQNLYGLCIWAMYMRKLWSGLNMSVIFKVGKSSNKIFSSSKCNSKLFKSIFSRCDESSSVVLLCKLHSKAMACFVTASSWCSTFFGGVK